MKNLTRLVDPVRAAWEESLKLDVTASLKSNLVLELAEYLNMPNSEIERLCRLSVRLMKKAWLSTDRSTTAQVIKFYQEPNHYLFELVWWHSLVEDRRFLDSVICMKYAMQKGLYKFLDFGCGIGSHSIMMAHHGFDTSMFDVSKQLIDFAKWRMSRRGCRFKAFVGNGNWMPESTYDFILVLDVLEHVMTPYETLMRLVSMLRVGGILCVSVPPIPVPDKPMHFNYFRRHLLTDAASLGLRHIKYLTYIDIFVKESDNLTSFEELCSLPKRHTLVDALFESAINPLFVALPEPIVRFAALVDRALAATRQTWYWYHWTGA